jgi:hypothetical protein
MWKQAVVAYFEVDYLRLHGETEENDWKSPSV